MLSFVQSWFSEGANPVGVDFGTECLRLAQVDRTGGEYRLIAAASAQVPVAIRNDSAARLEYFTHTLRDLWIDGNFRGRRAVLALPAASLHIQHLRMPKMDDESLTKALKWETQGKLPIDASTALIRHVVAGDVYHEQEPRSEVIVLAAQRDFVEQLLAAAGSARLDVVGMTVQPQALIDCFAQIYRRVHDSEFTNCFVDIGYAASRAVIARGGHILFARNLPIGSEHFTKAVAAELKITTEEAGALRLHLAESGDDDINGPTRTEHACMTRHAKEEHAESKESGGVATMTPTATRKTTDKISVVERATRKTVTRMIEELDLCRRYHEATFPNRAVERLIFVGGEARQRKICQEIARGLGLAAQIGDPLVRMGRTTQVGIESGIDRRLPQPAWAAAIGLSMGSLEIKAQ